MTVVWSHVGLISIMGLWVLITEELTVSIVLTRLGLTQPQSHHEAEDSPPPRWKLRTASRQQRQNPHPCLSASSAQGHGL